MADQTSTSEHLVTVDHLRRLATVDRRSLFAGAAALIDAGDEISRVPFRVVTAALEGRTRLTCCRLLYARSQLIDDGVVDRGHAKDDRWQRPWLPARRDRGRTERDPYGSESAGGMTARGPGDTREDIMTDHEPPRELTQAGVNALLAVPYEPAPGGLPLTRHITAEEAAAVGLAFTPYGDVGSGPRAVDEKEP